MVAVEDVNQQQFINTLLNVRNGKCTLEDWRFLQTRTKGRVVDFETRFIDALRLFASNEKVNEFNTKKLQVTLLQASYNSTNRAARATDASKFRGLQDKLYLAVNAKVTLTTNLQTSNGLTNGAKGTVFDIVYRENKLSKIS